MTKRERERAERVLNELGLAGILQIAQTRTLDRLSNEQAKKWLALDLAQTLSSASDDFLSIVAFYIQEAQAQKLVDFLSGYAKVKI
ncbi:MULTISPECIES: hypothetical protein [unclassified Campylobacter]|uniref:hypothetical protein n=1 Tax=unclassified Campylobacter TaxID=2593542 RepID=UPI003D32C582